MCADRLNSANAWSLKKQMENMSATEQEVCSDGGRFEAHGYKPHAVVVPSPGQGHINPLLHLSKRLASQGFSITFVNLQYTHSRVMSSIHRQEEDEKNQQVIGSSPFAKLDIKFVCIPDGIPASTPIGDVPELCRGVVRSSSAFEDLLHELHPPPTCIISDMFVLHSQDAANKFGIPRVSFWTQSVATYEIYQAVARGLILLPSDVQFRMPFLKIGSEDKLISDIGGLPPLRKKDLPGFIQCNDPSDFMFNDCVAPLSRAQEAMCVLFNSFDEMEGQAVEALRLREPECRFYTIGPVLPEEYFSGMKLSRRSLNMAPGFWAEDYDCLHWLDKQEVGSVLYVSFGSITELSDGELKELAVGLEASRVPVLWVLRPGTGDKSGHSALPPGFKERNAGHIMIIEWAPQLHVLAHPAVGAFFTHAGWNSVLEGVVQGKPLLGYPYFDDQMLNCWCIEKQWGNGLALEKHGEELLTHSLVERKIHSVMSDAKVRETALRLGESARRAVQSTESGSSAANFKSFIEALTKAQIF